jgi:hypothetical protein
VGAPLVAGGAPESAAPLVAGGVGVGALFAGAVSVSAAPLTAEGVEAGPLVAGAAPVSAAPLAAGSPVNFIQISSCTSIRWLQIEPSARSGRAFTRSRLGVARRRLIAHKQRKRAYQLKGV